MLALLPQAGLALLAGALSTLSPCVLPILPVVIAGAQAEHRWAPAALAMGVAAALVFVAGVVAAFGSALGVYVFHARWLAAGALIIVGLALVIPAVHRVFQSILSPLGRVMNNTLGAFKGRGLAGQGALGFLLGAAWTPCVGPTLGAAAVLAAQRQELGAALTIMLLFGLGAALPLLLIATGLRSIINASIGLRRFGAFARYVLGAGCLAIGVLILSGLDKQLETFLLRLSPDWLTAQTTRF